jgi:hypothetical protein
VKKTIATYNVEFDIKDKYPVNESNVRKVQVKCFDELDIPQIIKSEFKNVVTKEVVGTNGVKEKYPVMTIKKEADNG